MKAQELKEELSNFSGTERYHKLTLTNLKATDGIAHMATVAGAFWLIDAIGSYQGDKRIAHLEIQFWHLIVEEKNRAILYCVEDKDMPTLILQEIEYTDFPKGEWQFYVQQGVIMLPDEY